VLLLSDISLYLIVEQWLKCSTSEMFNCLIQFLLTVILSIKECVFLVERVFREGNRYTNLVQEQLLKNSQKHLYLITLQFVDLLRHFMKQAQC
jgi:hypothetical protein